MKHPADTLAHVWARAHPEEERAYPGLKAHVLRNPGLYTWELAREAIQAVCAGQPAHRVRYRSDEMWWGDAQGRDYTSAAELVKALRLEPWLELERRRQEAQRARDD